MNFLNTIFAQIRDLMMSMTPGARITAGLLLTIVVVSLGVLFRTNSTTADEYLFGAEPLSNSQMTRMEAAMAAANLKGWERQGNRIRVPRGQKDEYIAAIGAARALPHDAQTFMDEALNSGGLFEPREKWNLRTKAVRENQLSHLLAKMPYVEYATVMLDVEESRGPNRKPRATATVFVEPRLGEVIDSQRMKAIKEFVAFSDASLTAAEVNVTSGGDSAPGGGDVVFDDPYLQARSELERSYQQRLHSGLNYIPGVRIVVSGEVDNTSKQTRIETTPEGAEMVSETIENESTETRVADGGGPPGQLQNSASANGAETVATRENTSRTERDSTKTQNAVGAVQEESIKNGYVPKEIYVSVAIPSDYVAKAWRKAHPDAKEDDYNETERAAQEQIERTNVENFVQNVLPRLPVGQNEYSQVKVVFFETLQPEPMADPTLTATALGWASQNWTTLSMLGLAGFSLLLLRNVARPQSASAGPLRPTLQLETGKEAAVDASEENEEVDRPRLRLRKGDSLKDDLSDMVRENPDAAAAILRSWISNAG
jgi:flagellar M-ring protein FliF